MRTCFAVLAVLTLVRPAWSDEDAPVYPIMAGRTVIHSQGVTGITMELRAPTKVFGDDMSLTVAPASRFAQVLLLDQTPNPELCDFCVHQFIQRYPDYHPGYVSTGSCGTFVNGEFVENGCTFDRGLVEIYLVSDGPITFTLERPDLPGEVEVQATADVDGILERIPTRCEPLNQCEVFGYGSLAREVGTGGRAGYGFVVAWENIESSGNGTLAPSEGRVVPCAYPSWLDPGASPATDDHSYGCDVLPSERTSGPPENQVIRTAAFLAPFPTPNGGGMISGDVSFQTHGQQYLGFAARQVKTTSPGHYDAWGLWLNQGMSCPSDDFTDCRNLEA